MPAALTLIEFPADDPERARAFWSGLLGVTLEERTASQGEGWQTGGLTPHDASGQATEGVLASPASGGAASPAVGVHQRGRGPGDSFSLPYFHVPDMRQALAQVASLGGSIVHPGERWAICKDSEGSPFGLASQSQDAADAALVQGPRHDAAQTSRP